MDEFFENPIPPELFNTVTSSIFLILSFFKIDFADLITDFMVAIFVEKDTNNKHFHRNFFIILIIYYLYSKTFRMKNLKISIITVVKNNKDTIEKNILSLLNQNYKNYEQIIIDGGSEDGTVEIINKYKKMINIFYIN